VRWAVRRLIARGVLRLVERSKAGHVVEVRLPAEVPAAPPGPIPPRRCAPIAPTPSRSWTFSNIQLSAAPSTCVNAAVVSIA
jgi:hypothetical protein